MVTEFVRDPAGARSREFWSWLLEHPKEYFVNLNTSSAARIHRADCPHMKFPRPEAINFLSRGKLCSPDRAELEREVARRGIAVETCPDCG
jgi:hypothetical protein